MQFQTFCPPWKGQQLYQLPGVLQLSTLSSQARFKSSGDETFKDECRNIQRKCCFIYIRTILCPCLLFFFFLQENIFLALSSHATRLILEHSKQMPNTSVRTTVTTSRGLTECLMCQIDIKKLPDMTNKQKNQVLH